MGVLTTQKGCKFFEYVYLKDVVFTVVYSHPYGENPLAFIYSLFSFCHLVLPSHIFLYSLMEMKLLFVEVSQINSQNCVCPTSTKETKRELMTRGERIPKCLVLVTKPYITLNHPIRLAHVPPSQILSMKFIFLLLFAIAKRVFNLYLHPVTML